MSEIIARRQGSSVRIQIYCREPPRLGKKNLAILTSKKNFHSLGVSLKLPRTSPQSYGIEGLKGRGPAIRYPELARETPVSLGHLK